MPIKADRYEFGVVDNETFSLSADSVAVSQYDAVKLVGEMEVAATDTAGETYLGVAVTDADPGEDVGVYLQGAHPANVANPDGSVTFGQNLIPSGNAGELRPPNTGGATGESDGPNRTLTAEDGDGLALLLLG